MTGRFVSAILLFSLGFLPCSAWAKNETPPGYRVYKQMLAGIQTLELLVDVKLPEKYLKQLATPGNADLEVLDAKGFAGSEPNAGMLRLVSKDGLEVARQLLKKPVVNLDRFYTSPGGANFFLVSESWLMDASISGDDGVLTRFIEVAKNEIVDVKAVMGRTGKSEPFIAWSTQRNAWKIKEGKRGAPPQILKVDCHRLSWGNTPKFETVYSRLLLEGAVWAVKERKRVGEWTFEQGFPADNRFP